MVFSLTVFVAMILLLPGFALFAGVFGAPTRTFRASPPPPTSFAALSLVIAGACVGHLAGLALAGLLTLAGGLSGVRLLPSPYELLTRLAASRPIDERELASFLLVTLTVSAALALAAARAMAWDANRREAAKRGRWAEPLYGWLADIVRKAAPANRYVTAFVLCDLEWGRGQIGYEGTVDALTLTADKEVASILLTDANAFRITVDRAKGVTTRTVLRTEPIERLHIPKDQIVNIAFEIYELEARA